MIWWWDNYIHPKNLYTNFTSLRQFTASIPWSQGGWKRLNTKSAPLPKNPTGTGATAPTLNVYALGNGPIALAWIQNADHHWKNVYENKPILPIPEAEVVLQEFSNGKFRVEWWDTLKGGILRQESVKSTNGELSWRVANLADDIALRVLPK